MIAYLVVTAFVLVVVGGPIALHARALLRLEDTGRHCACDARGLPRPTAYGRHDGSIVVSERDEVLVRPANGRYLGTQPRRTPYPTAADPMVPLETDDDPPWDVSTRQQPALDDAPVYGEAPVATVLEAERRDVNYPCCVHCGGFVCDRPYHPAPCDEDGCQLDVDEAERQYALAMGPDGCEEAR